MGDKLRLRGATLPNIYLSSGVGVLTLSKAPPVYHTTAVQIRFYHMYSRHRQENGVSEGGRQGRPALDLIPSPVAI